MTKLTCIVCPVGCRMTATYDGKSYSVSGNSCSRGKKYAIDEMTSPRRMVTTVIKLKGGGVVPVKTQAPVLKSQVFDILAAIDNTSASTPIKIGDVVLVIGETKILATDNRL